MDSERELLRKFLGDEFVEGIFAHLILNYIGKLITELIRNVSRITNFHFWWSLQDTVI